MEISWHSGTSFTIRSSSGSILTDPTKSAALVRPIVLLSEARQIPKVGEEPFIIAEPGEYEVRGVEIRAFSLKRNGGLVYLVRANGIRVGWLARLGELSEEAEGELAGVDLLLLPPVERLERLQSLIGRLEPKIVVPSTAQEKLSALAEALGGGGERTKSLKLPAPPTTHKTKLVFLEAQ